MRKLLAVLLVAFTMSLVMSAVPAGAETIIIHKVHKKHWRHCHRHHHHHHHRTIIIIK